MPVGGPLDVGAALGFRSHPAAAGMLPLCRYALEESPGVYNEAVFRGLDYFLDEARKRDMRVSVRAV